MRHLAIAALAACFAAPFAATAAPRSVGLGAAYPLACASAYHLDAGGNCQPDGGQVNRYCPAGLVFHPTFDGWSCDPAPPEAY